MTRPHSAIIARRAPLAMLAACLLHIGLPSLAAEDSTPQEFVGETDEGQAELPLEELEPVFVYGGLAVPQLWKVSRDDHVMWIAINRAAPAGSTWRMDEIETRMAGSKLLLLPGRAYANPDVGIFRALTLLRSAFKAAKNPDGQTLKDVLPPETYARWRALKTTYVGRDNDIEEWRPSIALAELEEKIADKLRPGRAASPDRPPAGPMLQPLVEKAARKKRVRLRTMPEVVKKVEVENIRAKLKSTHSLSLVDEKCVADYLGFLESQVEYWKQQAEAGNESDAPVRPANCNEADLYIRKVRSGEIPDSAGFVGLIGDLERETTRAREELDAAWMEAAQAALAKNPSTIAVLHAVNIAGARSYIDKLRALGYAIEEPSGTP